VRKYTPIHSNHEKTPIVELPKLILALKTLLGASVVITNTFSVNSLSNLDYLEIFLETIGKNGGYVGEVFNKYNVLFSL
jgi:hypothetical protein